MTPTAPFTLASPTAFGCALALAVVAGAVAVYRRPAVPRLTHGFVSVGLVLLALAAGGLTWRRPVAADVVVMVDLSPSTRTAQYREPAALRARVVQLLGNVPHRVAYLAGDQPVEFGELSRAAASRSQPDAAAHPPDLPTDRTVYAPPPASAVVLFSDGRFNFASSAPPTFAVIDPNLEEPDDAAVQRLEVRDGDIVVATRNGGGPRELSLSGASTTPQQIAPPGAVVLRRPLAPDRRDPAVVARLAGGDAWPENDALAAYVPPPAEAERWWVGAGNSAGPHPDGSAPWRTLRPSDLPSDPAAFLAPSVIALDNVGADDLPEPRRRLLAQYVRDLGGGLLVFGGDRAFAAGGYAGTVIESLSPLASTPPEPAAHWVLLVDSSGSMNAPAAGAAPGAAAGRTRWHAAAEAAAAIVRALPPNDLVSVGEFAGAVNWWARGRRAADAASAPLPPPGATATGPTELRRALEEATSAAEPSPPTQFVLLTDGGAELPDPRALADAMARKNVRLHLLALGEGKGLPALRRIVDATGGTLVREDDPSRWTEGARSLLRRAAPDLLRRNQVTVQYLGELRALPPRAVSPWNRTWLKDGATLLARAGSGERVGPAPAPGRVPVPETQTEPLAARWAAGEGTASAVAFANPTAQELAAFVRLASRAPRDPRLRVTWDAGARLCVAVDAVDGGRYLNGLELSLHLADAARPDAPAQAQAIPQTAPGRYELALDAPRGPALATVRLAGAAGAAPGAVDRAAVAGRYEPEFESVGNDRAALRELAARTGGAVVEPGDARPLDLPRPRREVPLAAPLAAAGAACVAAGLVWWRRS